MRSVAGVLLAVLMPAVLLAGCSDRAESPAADPTTTSAAPSPDAVLVETMDSTAPGWRTEFAVEGATVDDAPALAVLAAQTACADLETRSVEEVLLRLASGALPPETTGTLLYASTVAYCPDYTTAVQQYADANR